MSEFQTFDCPNCGDTFLFQGKEYVLHKHTGELTPDVMKFRVVVDICNCPCGARFAKNQWKKKIIDVEPTETEVGKWRYLTLENGRWTETEADAEKARGEIEVRKKTLQAKLAREAKAAKKGGKK